MQHFASPRQISADMDKKGTRKTLPGGQQLSINHSLESQTRLCVGVVFRLLESILITESIRHLKLSDNKKVDLNKYLSQCVSFVMCCMELILFALFSVIFPSTFQSCVLPNYPLFYPINKPLKFYLFIF